MLRAVTSQHRTTPPALHPTLDAARTIHTRSKLRRRPWVCRQSRRRIRDDITQQRMSSRVRVPHALLFISERQGVSCGDANAARPGTSRSARNAGVVIAGTTVCENGTYKLSAFLCYVFYRRTEH